MVPLCRVSSDPLLEGAGRASPLPRAQGTGRAQGPPHCGRRAGMRGRQGCAAQARAGRARVLRCGSDCCAELLGCRRCLTPRPEERSATRWSEQGQRECPCFLIKDSKWPALGIPYALETGVLQCLCSGELDWTPLEAGALPGALPCPPVCSNTLHRRRLVCGCISFLPFSGSSWCGLWICGWSVGMGHTQGMVCRGSVRERTLWLRSGYAEVTLARDCGSGRERPGSPQGKCLGVGSGLLKRCAPGCGVRPFRGAGCGRA